MGRTTNPRSSTCSLIGTRGKTAVAFPREALRMVASIARTVIPHRATPHGAPSRKNEPYAAETSLSVAPTQKWGPQLCFIHINIGQEIVRGPRAIRRASHG